MSNSTKRGRARPLSRISCWLHLFWYRRIVLPVLASLLLRLAGLALNLLLVVRPVSQRSLVRWHQFQQLVRHTQSAGDVT